MSNTLFKYASIIASVLVAGVMISSCNDDGVIEEYITPCPEIILDSTDGTYTVLVNNPLIIAPKYENAENATYLWTMDARPIADTPEFTHTWDVVGEYYLSVTVTTAGGSVSEDLKVEVVEPGIPVVSIPISSESVTILLGTDYVIHPEVSNSDLPGFKIQWSVDGKVAGNEIPFTFHATELGEYAISVTASNSEGEYTRSFTIHVVSELPIHLEFPTPTYFCTSTTRYTFPGRPVFISPIVDGAGANSYVWSVDGKDTGCTMSTYKFVTDTPGEYTVSVLVNSQYSASLTVVCVDADESDRYRKATAASSPRSNKVYEWVPAPGQFIGETQTGGMTGNETTMELANQWAENRLRQSAYVSLGGWGGYIVVGFDHSIAKRDGQFDFAVQGNAFLNAASGQGGSNEPGIIYVMQDVNGNGLPDDEWYELRGSESGKSGTVQDYSITYFRPAGPRMNVQWTDCFGEQGYIDYLSAFHRQDYYYPAWIDADSYTLRGTRLESRTSQDPATGMWDNWLFDWGYSDNMGSDNLGGDAIDGAGQRNGFLIENAMYPDLSGINLQYIDFIKVQTGVNAKAGWLGENSTEVFGFIDLSIKE